MQSQEPQFGSHQFRQALGRFATGITVVTMRGHDDELVAANTPSIPRTFGITVNAFMSISLEPPLVAVSIDRSARAHATLRSTTEFGISVLAQDQELHSDFFAGRPVRSPTEPFEEYAGFPVVKGALTQLVCRSHQAVDVGDHTIFVGQVTALRTRPGQPLLFFGGAYHGLPDLALAR
jgi:flavin reductase (DIM6/NTAB) family NADH-FMN oxidoreductase RutF